MEIAIKKGGWGATVGPTTVKSVATITFRPSLRLRIWHRSISGEVSRRPRLVFSWITFESLDDERVGRVHRDGSDGWKAASKRTCWWSKQAASAIHPSISCCCWFCLPLSLFLFSEGIHTFTQTFKCATAPLKCIDCYSNIITCSTTHGRRV